MQKIIKPLIALFLIFILCAPEILSAEPKKIGVSIPLTGMAATYGTAFNNGLTLYKEQHPDSSANIKFVIDDSEYVGTKVVSGIQKMVAVDKVDLLFVWGSTPSEVAAPVAGRIKVPMITMGFDSMAKDRPYVASLASPLASYRDLLSKFMSERKWTRMGVLMSNIGATQAFVDLLEPAVTSYVFEESVATDLNDFNSTLLRIKGKPVDILLASLAPEQYPQLAKALIKNSYKPFLISGDQLGDDELRAVLKPATTGLAYFSGFFESSFVEKYKARFGNSSHVYEGASGYALGIMARAIFDRNDSLVGTKLIAALPAIEFPPTTIGPLKFSSGTDGVAAQLKPKVVVDE